MRLVLVALFCLLAGTAFAQSSVVVTKENNGVVLSPGSATDEFLTKQLNGIVTNFGNTDAVTGTKQLNGVVTNYGHTNAVTGTKQVTFIVLQDLPPGGDGLLLKGVSN